MPCAPRLGCIAGERRWIELADDGCAFYGGRFRRRKPGCEAWEHRQDLLGEMGRAQTGSGSA